MGSGVACGCGEGAAVDCIGVVGGVVFVDVVGVDGICPGIVVEWYRL